MCILCGQYFLPQRPQGFLQRIQGKMSVLLAFGGIADAFGLVPQLFYLEVEPCI